MDDPQEPTELFIKGLPRQRWHRPEGLRKRREELERQEKQQIEEALASLYYWWWLVIQESEDFQKAIKRRHKDPDVIRVAEAFGPLGRRDFGPWWLYKGRRIFAQREALPRVRAMESGERAMPINAERAKLYLEIPLTLKRSTVVRKINAFLNQHYGVKGRPQHNVFAHSTALLDINKSSKVRITTVQQVYALWQRRKQHPAETWVTTGEALRISPVFINNERTSPYDRAYNDRMMTLSVQRLYRKAEALIYWAARGDFPCTKPIPKT
jgi:hypothetical protein